MAKAPMQNLSIDDIIRETVREAVKRTADALSVVVGQMVADQLGSELTKRGVNAAGVEDEPIHSGKTFSLTLTFKQGIDAMDAKEITKLIKAHNLKVQTSIQGDKIRVTGKKRDDLQSCIALLKKSEIQLPLQFNNFRD